MKRRIAILGAGNGGQAFAAYFKSNGHVVKLYDSFQDTVDAINSRGNIELTGSMDIKIDFAEANTDMGKVVEGAEIIIIINPSTYHREIAAELAKHLKEDQIIFINPGATFGSFAFKKSLLDNDYNNNVLIAESNILLFACRLQEVGKVFVGAKKDRILVSTFPANRLEQIKEIMLDIIPEAQFVKNVLVTAIDNTNPTVHPMPAILNIGWLESGQKFSFMQQAVSPTISNYMEKMDKERLEVGEKLGLIKDENLFNLHRQYEMEYGVYGQETLRDIFQNCKAYTHIYGPSNLHTNRYITEDVGMGLAPLVSVGEMIGVDVSKSKLIIQICEAVLEMDLSHGDNCRNVENLGLEGMTAEQIIHYADTGEK